jgi:hypothetical protein
VKRRENKFGKPERKKRRKGKQAVMKKTKPTKASTESGM